MLLASEACGIGEVALDRALAYAKDRVVFDRPIGANQAISHPLAHAHAQLHAAWMMALHAGRRYDAGLECGEAANTAKYLAAEASFYAADHAVQTLGGMGYASEYHVERYWREARLQRIARSSGFWAPQRRRCGKEPKTNPSSVRSSGFWAPQRRCCGKGPETNPSSVRSSGSSRESSETRHEAGAHRLEAGRRQEASPPA